MSQSHALSGVLGGKQRIKQKRQGFFLHARPGIGDAHDDVGVIGCEINVDAFWAAGFHGIKGIADDVHANLFDAYQIGMNDNGGIGFMAFKGAFFLLKLRFEQLQRVIKGDLEVDRFEHAG